MKIGPELLAQEMWTLPSWQRVVQLHFVKKIQQHQNCKLALASKPDWLSNPDRVIKRREYFAQQQNIYATDEKLLQLAQRLCEVGK